MKLLAILVTCSLFVTANLAAETKNLEIGDKLKLKINSASRCIFGDLDAIKFETREFVEKGKDAKVIVSIESLNSDKKLNQVFVDTSDTSAGSAAFTFDVSDFPAGPVGLYICSDRSNQGSCGGKAGADFTELFKRYQLMNDAVNGKAVAANQEVADPKNLPADKNYYSTIINLKKNVAEYSNPVYVDELGSLVAEVKDQKKADQTKDLIKKTGSLPLAAEGDTLLINLPSYDIAKCAD